jgi:ATP-dependent DNA helicase RecG
MFLRTLSSPVSSIQKLRPSVLKALERIEIKSFSDILQHYPRTWEDRSKTNPLSGYRTGSVCTTVKVLAKDWIGFGRKKTLKVFVEDESARASLLCYNRPWLGKQLVEGEKYRLFGNFEYKYKEIQSSTFDFEKKMSNEQLAISNEDREKSSFNVILPVYHLSLGLSQAALRGIVLKIMEKYGNEIEDELPSDIIESYGLMQKKDAVKNIHFPQSFEELERAKRTLIYEELFYLEVMVALRFLQRRERINKDNSAFKTDGLQFTPLQKRLLERLPFSLTSGQNEAVKDINLDMGSGIPMARLLQGDVGSGKTLVSFLAALKAVEEGEQAAIMAPTELLARQHAENAARLLEPLGCRIAFLTGNVKAAGRKELLKNLKEGEIDIVVGTHALFSRDVEYKKLKLVVIDEQHRFGVTQRSAIMSKGEELSPDLLMMSATPIPRTLALTVFGDMDVSTIKDMPPGRKPVKTHLAKQSNEKKVYDFIRRELESGRQAYFVYPLIESGQEDDLKDAVSMEQRLSKEIFPKYKTALIHSRLTEDEKRQTMESFRKGEIKLLAATSVVEVGVDVPNATCMVVEHAERFGLSALHQLRGRVGRGSEQSYCFLVYSDELTEEGKTRLKVMLENSDGFIIAEEDLKLRGPGIITGTEQSGYMVLGLANPIRDMEELEKARADAFKILENDPDLLLANNRVIARVLKEAPPFGEVGF